MLKKMLSLCILALLGLQFIFGPAAIAQPLVGPFTMPLIPVLLAAADTPQTAPAQSSPQTALEQSSTETSPTTPQSPDSTAQQATKQRQQVTYPNPPDVYDYGSLRQYDEDIYGEKDTPLVPIPAN